MSGCIPVKIAEVSTKQLPVDIQTERDVKIWHDESGCYVHLILACQIDVTNREPVVEIERIEQKDIWKIKNCDIEGTLRICELIPNEEHEADGNYVETS